MTTAFFTDERCFWHGGGNYAMTLPVGGLVQPGGGLPESPETKRRLTSGRSSGKAPLSSSSPNAYCSSIEYGWFSSGKAPGRSSLNWMWPNREWVWESNWLIGRAGVPYPPDTRFVANVAAVGFSDVAANDFSLAHASALRAKGFRGANPGVDFGIIRAVLIAALAGVPNELPKGQRD